jgi:PBP1b-binding outer membrane lipoprotein LpoB
MQHSQQQHSQQQQRQAQHKQQQTLAPQGKLIPAQHAVAELAEHHRQYLRLHYF